jgi:hypothetical protein
MARSTRKTPIFGNTCSGRGSAAAHRAQLASKRRLEARRLIQRGEFEALPNRYVEDERNRPDDGRRRSPSWDFRGPAYKARTK